MYFKLRDRKQIFFMYLVMVRKTLIRLWNAVVVALQAVYSSKRNVKMYRNLLQLERTRK